MLLDGEAIPLAVALEGLSVLGLPAKLPSQLVGGKDVGGRGRGGDKALEFV
jgi:hypothetical protein